jgi:hypothetical protein
MMKKDRQICIDTSYFWIDIFGKYFLIKEEQPKYLYMVLSLSPTYILNKRKWMKE